MIYKKIATNVVTILKVMRLIYFLLSFCTILSMTILQKLNQFKNNLLSKKSWTITTSQRTPKPKDICRARPRKGKDAKSICLRLFDN